MLQGFSVDEHIVEYHLRRKKWRLNDDYQIYYFTLREPETMAKEMIKMYIYRLQKIMQTAYIAEYENGIIAIVASPRQRISEAINTKLHDLCIGLKFVCGASMVCHSFMNIKYAFIQAKGALKAEYLIEKQSIYYFRDYYIAHVTEMLELATSLKSLCHPQISTLYTKSEGKGHEFVKTLQTYLLCGKNTSATAKALHLHRNTLIYRLERLHDLLGDDLDSPDDNMQFLLLFSCFIVNKLHNIDQM